MKKIVKFILIAALIGSMAFSSSALADDWYESEKGYFTLLDEAGEELTLMAREMFVDDEYISSDNKHYRITKVDKDSKKAHAEYLGDVKLPEVELADAAITASLLGRENPGNILLYCTHTDESYVPSDGTESEKGGGGILDVAEALQNALKERGINAVLDKTLHEPHDAAAYRRSRATALQLIKQNMPVAAVFDIHRDAVPKTHYVAKVDGQYMTKVRIVIGRKNQNYQANKELAYKIKAVADKAYPGLFKDIYIGKGEYNQELSPRSLLLEIGTHENTKEAAMKAAGYLADVIAKAMYGGTIQGKTQEGGEAGEYSARSLNQETRENRSGVSSILWLVGIILAGSLGFFLLSSGGKEKFSKMSKFARDEFSSFLGRKRRK